MSGWKNFFLLPHKYSLHVSLLHSSSDKPQNRRVIPHLGLLQVGLLEALAIIVAAEIGDKSFFVAMILAMKYDKRAIFVGCMAALILQSIISAAFGAIVSQIDHDLVEWAAGTIYCESRSSFFFVFFF